MKTNVTTKITAKQASAIKPKFLFGSLLFTFFTALTAFNAFGDDSGGASGNGNGDTAFAFQSIADANPNFEPQYILLKAFKESANNPVQLNFVDESANKKDESPPHTQVAFFLEHQNLHGYVIETDGSSDYLYDEEIVLRRDKRTSGPLLGNKQSKKMDFSLKFREAERTFYTVLRTNPSVIVNSEASYGGGYDYKSKIEFRQYNSKIMIYAIYPTTTQGLVNSSKAPHCERAPIKAVPPDTICRIGYLWVD